MLTEREINLKKNILKNKFNYFSLTNFESSLLSVLKRYNEENVFLNGKETNTWSDLSMINKIDIIHLLCEMRLQLSDVEAKFNVFYFKL